MTDTETLAWITVDEASEALKCSRRTIERRITRGLLQVAWQGRVRVVGVATSDKVSAGAGVHPATVSAMLQGLQVASAETRQLAVAVAIDRRDWTQSAQREVATVRRWSRVAWACVAGLLAVAVFAWQEVRAVQARAEAQMRAVETAQAEAEDARADLRAMVEWIAGSEVADLPPPIDVETVRDVVPSMGAVADEQAPSR